MLSQSYEVDSKILRPQTVDLDQSYMKVADNEERLRSVVQEALKT